MDARTLGNVSLRAGDLRFARPPHLQATAPPERRGRARDDVRLLVSGAAGHTHHRFVDLPGVLRPGDLLVVNDSATLPASLPARTRASERLPGTFRLNFSTRYGDRVWLAEPRFALGRPGPLPLRPGDTATLNGHASVRFLAPHPGLERLWFVTTSRPLDEVMEAIGEPIRYDYVDGPEPLERYQTMFARRPGSAEMPSAARPFTPRVVADLRAHGVSIAALTLHTGVSSLEVDGDDLERAVLYAEPYAVSTQTAEAVNATRAAGGRVVAVGTTVVRALETVYDGRHAAPGRGFTRRFVRPGHGGGAVDGLLTGLHDPGTSHLALLYAVAGVELVRRGYAHAVAGHYLWHEFGDVHLLLPGREAAS